MDRGRWCFPVDQLWPQLQALPGASEMAADGSLVVIGADTVYGNGVVAPWSGS
jgi:tRNA A37 threonylcarbamoyladenosine synthetase subunit TsaC/SUA5/YrdC